MSLPTTQPVSSLSVVNLIQVIGIQSYSVYFKSMYSEYSKSSHISNISSVSLSFRFMISKYPLLFIFPNPPCNTDIIFNNCCPFNPFSTFIVFSTDISSFGSVARLYCIPMYSSREFLKFFNVTGPYTISSTSFPFSSVFTVVFFGKMLLYQLDTSVLTASYIMSYAVTFL